MFLYVQPSVGALLESADSELTTPTRVQQEVRQEEVHSWIRCYLQSVWVTQPSSSETLWKKHVNDKLNSDDAYLTVCSGSLHTDKFHFCHIYIFNIYRERIFKICNKNFKGFRNVRKSIETGGDISVFWPITFHSASELLNPLKSTQDHSARDLGPLMLKMWCKWQVYILRGILRSAGMPANNSTILYIRIASIARYTRLYHLRSAGHN